jgi:Raf kinase inhibitor-like YbhB/YbcL family protein
MMLTSPAFESGGTIPKSHTCDGDNLSPPLAWSGVPDGTRSLLLSCDDSDAPGGAFHHWVVSNIPSSWTGLDEGFRRRAGTDRVQEAVNDFGRAGYGGPCPPRGHHPHRYRFRLSAVDCELDTTSSARCADVVRQARPHVIETAELTGLYGRD